MIHGLFNMLQNPALLIGVVGFWGILCLLFLETGVFFGFFFPGDSLLITAGLLASPYVGQATHLSFVSLLIGTPIAAILGNFVGFLSGYGLIQALLKRPKTFLLRQRHFDLAHDFYLKHGGKTIFLARFIPIVRTFAPIVAGVSRMPFGLFCLYNIIGGIIWTESLLVGGYYLGKAFGHEVLSYLHLLILAVVVISVFPIVWSVYKKPRC